MAELVLSKTAGEIISDRSFQLLRPETYLVHVPARSIHHLFETSFTSLLPFMNPAVCQRSAGEKSHNYYQVPYLFMI